MIDLLRAHLDGRGDVELHYERFRPPPVVGGSEFAVSLARSGVSTTVGADESLLAALRRVYPGVPYRVNRASAAPAGYMSSTVSRSTATLCSPMLNGPTVTFLPACPGVRELI